MKCSVEEFKRILPTICARETSSHPDGWTDKNPMYGHCAIVSVLAQELFGGEIVKVSLKGTKYENLRSHFFNVIDGKEIDFTIEQFGGNEPYPDFPRVIESKEEILSHPGTQQRYMLLKNKII